MWHSAEIKIEYEIRILLIILKLHWNPLIFFKISFFKKFFQEHWQSVKQLGPRSGRTFCRAWSGSNLFAKIISRQHKSTAGMQYTPPRDTTFQYQLLYPVWRSRKKMPKIENENKFLTSINGYNSVHIRQNLPICNPRTLLHNIHSHTMFEENR